MPSHVREGNGSMCVNNIFSHVSHADNENLYGFVVCLSRKSTGMINTKPKTSGIVVDLCEILHSMVDVNVMAVIGENVNSWVAVKITGDDTLYTFMDMNRLSTTSLESMTLTAFFSRNRVFLDAYTETAIFTPLVRCFEYALPLDGKEEGVFHIGQRESFVDTVFSSLTAVSFPWLNLIDAHNSNTILQNIIKAICDYALGLNKENLMANTQRFFLMQRPNYAIALVNFVSNEYSWIPLCNDEILTTEKQFTTMIRYASNYGNEAKNIRKKLLIFYSRILLNNDSLSWEANDCYTWLTKPEIDEGETLACAVLREKQCQEARSSFLMTKNGHILPLLWTGEKLAHRGLVVNDTHSAFGSVYALREYVNNNIYDMLHITARNASIEKLLGLVTICESILNAVVMDVRTYMKRCTWLAEDILHKMIDMSMYSSGSIDLSTFLEHFKCVCTPSLKVTEDIFITNDVVLFLKLPTEGQCTSAKAFHSVMKVDGNIALSDIWHNALEYFLSQTDKHEQEMARRVSRKADEPLETFVNVSFDSLNHVDNADKGTLQLLLRHWGLEHLLALSCFIPPEKMWVSAPIWTGEYNDIFSFASNAHLIGMTKDIVVYAINKKLCVTTMFFSEEYKMPLIMEVVNTYNTMLSNNMVFIGEATQRTNYSVTEVVELFKVLNVGYRGMPSSSKDIFHKALLCKAIVYVVFGINPNSTLEHVFSGTVDFLLTGPISHRAIYTEDEKKRDTEIQFAGDITLDTMIKAVERLYLGKVQPVQIIAGKLYILQGTMSCAFMMARSFVIEQEHLIRHVTPKNAQHDELFVYCIWASIVAYILLGYSVENIRKVYNAMHYGLRIQVTSIIRKTLWHIWSKYKDHLYFPELSQYNDLNSRWENNITNKSISLYRSILDVIAVGDFPKESVILPCDSTVSFVVENALERQENTIVSLLLTDWPMDKTWECYINEKQRLISHLKTYKQKAGLEPVSSLLQFQETKCACVETLLGKGTYLFLQCMISLIKYITTHTTTGYDAVVKVLDGVIADKNVSLITEETVCKLKLVDKTNQVIFIDNYTFALLGENIAVPFLLDSLEIDLRRCIDNDLILVTDMLMSKNYKPVQNMTVSNSDVSDWLFACLPWISQEKQIKAALFYLGGILDAMQLDWCISNEKLFHNFVIDAVNSIPRSSIQKETQRTFVRNVFKSVMDTMNKCPDVSACVLHVPSCAYDYCVVCTESKVSVYSLSNHKNDSIGRSLAQWLNKMKTFLQSLSVNSPREEFLNRSIEIGVDPISGKNTTRVFNFILSNDGYTGDFSLFDIIIRVSLLNAFIRDIPPTELYIRRHLIALGKILSSNTYGN